MNRVGNTLYAILLHGMIALFLAGCAAADRGAYPVLETIRPDVTASGVPGGKGVTVAVGPINLPGYIDRAVTIVETTINPVDVSSVDQDVYALQGEIPRVLTENLRVLFASSGIAVVPYTYRGRSDYRVKINLDVFDIAWSGVLETRAEWALYKAGEESPAMTRYISFDTPVEHEGDAGRKTAMSKALAEMSRSIALAVRPVLEGKQAAPAG